MRKLLLGITALYIPFAGAAYKCVDERGVTHVGDTPPAACASVVMHEISASGSLIRRIEPTPTPEQAKALLIDQERKREADKREAEQKRKDVALLSTYSTEREFDVVLERTINPIRARMASASERIKAIDARLAKLEEDMEFYKAGKSKAVTKKGDRDAPPHMLLAEQERLWHEKQTLASGLAQQEKEITQLQERFGADKKRWARLKTGVADAPAPAAAVADTKPVKKGY